MKNLKRKFQYGVAVVTTTAIPAVAMAEGIGDISSTITTEINKIIPVITAAGTALLSVYLLVKAFRMVSGFLSGK